VGLAGIRGNPQIDQEGGRRADAALVDVEHQAAVELAVLGLN
jgi:hypothetical protein